MVLNSKKFIDDFVQIEMYLKKYLGAPQIGFVQMVHQASKTHPVIKHYAVELAEYSQLRNAIVHNRIGESVAIAEPHDEVVATISKIVDELNQPKIVRKLLKHDKIFVTHPDANISEVLVGQRDRHYSVVPVYDHRIYAGIIHPRSYQRFLEMNPKIIDLSKVKVKDILSIYPDDERVIFESANTSIMALVEHFVTMQEKGRSLIAVLITENGKPHEKLLGVLTSADLPRLLAMLE